MSIHRLIREGRQRLGMSEQQFADAVGVSRGAVQQWEKPGGTAPKRSNQPRVAELLGISMAELLSGGSNIGPGDSTPTEVPLISEVEAGHFRSIDNFNPQGETPTVPVTVQVQRHTYALRVQGDSMTSESRDSFPDGSVIVVEPELAAIPGDYVIALGKGERITFKQLVVDAGESYLRPLNTRYPIRPLGNWIVIGVVREVTKRFR